MQDFSIPLTAASALAAPAQPLPWCHLLRVLLFCIFPRGGGSPPLPLLLTTDSSSHGNHQFSPDTGSLTYTANRNPTKQVSIRRELTSVPAATKETAHVTVSQIKLKGKWFRQTSTFPLPCWCPPWCLHSVTSPGYLPCQISEGTVLQTPAGVW